MKNTVNQHGIHHLIPSKNKAKHLDLLPQPSNTSQSPPNGSYIPRYRDAKLIREQPVNVIYPQPKDVNLYQVADEVEQTRLRVTIEKMRWDDSSNLGDGVGERFEG